MRGANLLAVLLLLSCNGQPPTPEKKTPEKPKPSTLATLEKPKPVSIPVSAPVSVPATTQSASLASTTQATSLGVALATTLEAASEPTSEPEDTKVTSYYLPVSIVELKGKQFFEVEHPNPAVKKRIEVMTKSKLIKGGCTYEMMSTAIVSFTCYSPFEMPSQVAIERRIGGGTYYSPLVYNFKIENSILVPIESSDIFKDQEALQSFINEENSPHTTSVPPDVSADDFNITGDGVAFFAEVSNTGSYMSVSFAEHPEFFKLDEWPLSSLKNIEMLPTMADISGFQKSIEVLPFDPKMPPASMPVYGTIVAGTHWKDSAGENYLLVTERSAKSKKDESLTSKYVNAYHFKQLDETITNVRTVFEKEENCALQNQAGLIKDSIMVVDLDLDGVGEVSYATHLGCANAGDAVPTTVFLLEAGAKYALRGLSKGVEAPTSEGLSASVSENFLLFLQERFGSFTNK